MGWCDKTKGSFSGLLIMTGICSFANRDSKSKLTLSRTKRSRYRTIECRYLNLSKAQLLSNLSALNELPLGLKTFFYPTSAVYVIASVHAYFIKSKEDIHEENREILNGT